MGSQHLMENTMLYVMSAAVCLLLVAVVVLGWCLWTLASAIAVPSW